MNAQQPLFEIDQQGRILILSPSGNMSTLELTSLDNAVHDVKQQLQSTGSRHVILDFVDTDYYGSTALGLFIKLWKYVRSVEGDMVFCNVSEHEQEILKLTHLDNLWTICPTLEDALQHLQTRLPDGI